ncbi:MAG: SOS response-associated peptidase [Cyanobacteria bacterium P01_A01_bin.84]
MCGRFSLSATIEAIGQQFDIEKLPVLEPQYNITPSQNIAVVFYDNDNLLRKCEKFHWGLIPSWASFPKMSKKLINARSETVEEKPSFRSAFKYRRCLILADGFYEWKNHEGEKQPFYFSLRHRRLFAIAGLWEKWKSPGGEEIRSCTILTTEANEILKPIHHRMPVILKPEYYNLWLNTEEHSPSVLKKLLSPYDPTEMSAYRVSKIVNNPRNNSLECIAPLN